jgi:hypothetical protein
MNLLNLVALKDLAQLTDTDITRQNRQNKRQTFYLRLEFPDSGFMYQKPETACYEHPIYATPGEEICSPPRIFQGKLSIIDAKQDTLILL